MPAGSISSSVAFPIRSISRRRRSARKCADSDGRSFKPAKPLSPAVLDQTFARIATPRGPLPPTELSFQHTCMRQARRDEARQVPDAAVRSTSGSLSRLISEDEENVLPMPVTRVSMQSGAEGVTSSPAPPNSITSKAAARQPITTVTKSAQTASGLREGLQ